MDIRPETEEEHPGGAAVLEAAFPSPAEARRGRSGRRALPAAFAQLGV